MPRAPSVDLARYRVHINKLCDIALSRLPQMIDPVGGLAIRRADGDALTPSGSSVRYTAITALGLERAQDHGLPVGVDLEKLYDALSHTLRGVDDAGALGLVVWAAARKARPLAERAIADLLEFPGNVRRRGGAIAGSTELAWIIIGLAEALAAGVGPERDLRKRLDDAYRQLLQHRGDSGLISFARTAPGHSFGPVTRLLWSRLGFFDAQVYTIVASLRRDAVVGDPEARAVACRIGELLLAHQRPLGQWGWHYNVQDGQLIDLYPVYSVHQDGMAPMALLMLESAARVPATFAVARGLAWLFGENEMGELLAIPERNIIWRSMRRRAILGNVRYPLKVASLLGLGGGRDRSAILASSRMLEIDREMRPYHLGFCLYAFAEIAASTRAQKNGASFRVGVDLGELGAKVLRGRVNNSA